MKIYMKAIEKEVPIGTIKIPQQYRKSVPAPEKIKAAADDYDKYGFFAKPIIVNPQNWLFDGYTRYLAAVEKGLDKIKIVRICTVVKDEKANS